MQIGTVFDQFMNSALTKSDFIQRPLRQNPDVIWKATRCLNPFFCPFGIGFIKLFNPCGILDCGGHDMIERGLIRRTDRERFVDRRHLGRKPIQSDIALNSSRFRVVSDEIGR